MREQKLTTSTVASHVFVTQMCITMSVWFSSVRVKSCRLADAHADLVC